ncbi:hypothetical protein EW146_g7085 [Bondarzewia mesenterica]|uniref:C2H2-type domain-containing protein n=1 Tax=Bondarzewia mesenterica TaxID=1095465 RepID=A0A4V3XEC1_9AGAM|nr:hypothetical protein EW146_g7085 [Bondarzewia mesenterica]
MYFDPQDFMPSSSNASMLSGTSEDELLGFMSGGSLLPDLPQFSGGIDPSYQFYEGLLGNPTPSVIEGYHIPMMHHADPWQQPQSDAAYPLPAEYYGGPIPGGHQPMFAAGEPSHYMSGTSAAAVLPSYSQMHAAGELSQYMAGISPAAVLPSYDQIVHDHGVHAHHHPYFLTPTIVSPPLVPSPIVPSFQDTPPVLDMTAGDAIRSDISYEHDKDLPGIQAQQPEDQVLLLNNEKSKGRNDKGSPIAVAPSPDSDPLSAGGPSTAPPAMASQDIPRPSRGSARKRTTKQRRSRKANTPSPWACFLPACRMGCEPRYFGTPAELRRHLKHTKVHAEPAFKCPHDGCQSAPLTREDALRVHVETRHAAHALPRPKAP